MPFKKSFQIAITGASGYIASKLIEEINLMHSQIEIIALSRIKTIHYRNGKILSYSDPIDYNNISQLENTLRNADVLIHLAGLAHKTDIKPKEAQYEFDLANCLPTRSIVKCVHTSKIRLIIYMSSVSVYGAENESIILNERSYFNPKNYYGLSKLESENILRNGLSHSDIKLVILRPPMVYGMNCPGNLSKLLKLVQLCPVIPFKAFDGCKNFISSTNLISALITIIISNTIKSGDYLIADDTYITTSEIVNCFLQGFAKNTRRQIYIPKIIMRIIFILLGNKQVYDKLVNSLRIDSSKFKSEYNWKPVDNNIEYTMRSIATSNISKTNKKLF